MFNDACDHVTDNCNVSRSDFTFFFLKQKYFSNLPPIVPAVN